MQNYYVSGFVCLIYQPTDSSTISTPTLSRHQFKKPCFTNKKLCYTGCGCDQTVESEHYTMPHSSKSCHECDSFARLYSSIQTKTQESGMLMNNCQTYKHITLKLHLYVRIHEHAKSFLFRIS